MIFTWLLANRWALWLGAGVAVVAGAWIWLGAHDRAVVAACNADWTARLAKAESDARATIRAKEEAAYQEGVKAEAARGKADADDDERTEAVIREAIRASSSARACTLDAGTAAALNSLRDAP